MTLKELAGALKEQLERGNEADTAVMGELVESISSLAVREQAQRARMEKLVSIQGDRSPEDIERLLGEAKELGSTVEELKASLGERDRKLEKLVRERVVSEKALSEQLELEKQAVSRLVLDTGLTEELVKAKVKPSLLPAVKALIRERGVLSVESHGDLRRAVATVQRDGRSASLDLPSYVAQFVASDEGLAFVLAPANSGGGAQDARSAGAVTGNTMKEEVFAGLPPKEKARFMAGGGSLAA